MGADEKPQFLRHGEGDQEVGHGQQEARALALEPRVGVGLAALRTVPVVAGMIAVMKARTVRTTEELAAQSRGAAGEDLVQDLSLPPRHGRAEALQIFGRQLPEQLMNREAFTTVAGGGMHQRLPMKSSRRF